MSTTCCHCGDSPAPHPHPLDAAKRVCRACLAEFEEFTPRLQAARAAQHEAYMDERDRKHERAR